MNNQIIENIETTKKRVITIIRKNQPYPLFPQLIWRKIIENYFLPIDAFYLGATCRKIRILITVGMNRWWFYQYLRQTKNRPVNGIIHQGDYSNDCVSRDFRETLIDDESVKQYLDNLGIDLFIPCHKLEIKESYLQYIKDPGNWVGEWKFYFVERFIPQPLECWHWKISFYHHQDSIYNKRYRSKNNYYLTFIYYDYKQMRSRYKKRNLQSLKKKVAKLKIQHNQYIWYKKELKKVRLYLDQYREDCPERFESTS